MGAAVTAAFLGGLGAAVIPAAADQRTVIITVGGVTDTVPLPVPVPSISTPLGGVSGGGGQPVPAPPSAPPGVPVAPTAPVAPPSAGAPPARPTRHAHRPGTQAHPPSANGRRRPGLPPASRTTMPAVAPRAPVLPGGLRQANGVPTLGNPGLSLALPGAAPLGVPDFFIDTFRIPPFLLPIYQAAGIQYGVPWQVLAAINEIETDYGRNLSVSSAGAEGWMQFLPQTFAQYAVDANGDGKKDPYNPEDAIFTAARYLQAADARRNLPGAIFAYNHAGWYVQSVLLRAKLIGGLPDELVGALSELTQGRFPVAAPARYADDMRDAAVSRSTARLSTAALPRRNATNIYARPGAPVIASQDGEVVALGQSAARGRYLVLEDGYGNRYSYEQLGTTAASYPTLGDVARNASADSGAGTPAAPATAPSTPATAGAHALAPASTPPATPPTSSATPTDPLAGSVGIVRQRLFANPTRPNAFLAGGNAQLDRTRAGARGSLPGLLSQALALPGQSIVYRPLATGAHVLAGTILGRIGPGEAGVAPHLRFAIRPAGPGSPVVDPKPILDGWKLLEATAVYRAAGQNPLISGPLAIGQIFLAGKDELERTVLADPHIALAPCGRGDVASGVVDRRVLATLAYLSASGLRPRVSALRCGQNPSDARDAAAGDPSTLAALATPAGRGPTGPAGPLTAATAGPAAAALSGFPSFTAPGAHAPLPENVTLDIAAIDGIPILGHQGAGSITDVAIRRLLALQGANRPHEIVSLMHYPGSDNTVALPDHADRIHVSYSTLLASDPAHLAALDTALRPDQWIKLIDRLNAIPEPSPLAGGAASGGAGPAALSALPGLAGLSARAGGAAGAGRPPSRVAP